MILKRFISRLTVLSIIMGLMSAYPVYAADGKNPLANIACNSANVSEASGMGYSVRLTTTTPGSWAKIENIDFGKGKKYESVTACVAVTDEWAGGTVTYYLDSLDSSPIAQLKVKSTNNSWSDFQEQNAELDEPTIEGVHSLYIKMSSQGTCDCTYVRFNELKSGSNALVLPGDAAETRAEIPLKRLVSFGVLNFASNDKIGIESEIDKSELVKSALSLMKSDDPVVYSAFAKECGMNDEGTATVGDAAKVMLFVTGGASKINLLGEPTVLDFYAQAKTDDILDGITETADAPLTRELLYVIMDNTLSTKAFITQGEFFVKGDLWRVEYDKQRRTLLEYRFGIKTAEGVVSGDKKTVLNEANGIGSKRIKISDTVYDCKNYDAADYIGMNVKYWYNEDDEVLWLETKNNEIKEIAGEDIDTFSKNTVSYYETADKKKTIRLTDGFVVILNGRAKTNFGKDVFDDCRKAVFIDNNNDGKTEVVRITKTYDIAVQTVSGGKIYSKFSDKVIDCDSDDVEITNSVGKVYDDEKIKEISEWKILTVTESTSKDGKPHYEIVVCGSSVQGAVDSINEETDEITVEDNTYEMSPDVIYENNNTVGAGDEVKAYINTYGEIAVICKASFTSRYGFITKVAYENAKDEAQFKIFTENSEFVTAKAARRVTIDGTAYKNQQKIAEKVLGSGTFEGILAAYKLNADGDIRSIDLPYNKEAGETPAANESADSLHITAKNYVGHHRYVPMSFSGKIFYSSDVKVFTIPNDLTLEKYFRVSTRSLFAEDADYTIDAYQTTSNSFVSDILVRRVETVGKEDIKEHFYVYFVNGVYDVWDEENGEAVCEIEYLKNGKMVRNRVDSDILTDAKALARGDGIRFSTDINGTVTYIDKIYDRVSGTYPDGTTGWNSGERNIGGLVDVKYKDHFKLTGSDEIINSNTNETTIAVYDAKENKLTVGTSADIVDSSTGQPSKLYIRMYYGIPRSILIIR